jgi:hypothetical protein
MNYGALVLAKLRDEKTKLIETKIKDKFYLLQLTEDDLNFQIRFKDLDKLGIVVDYISIHKVTPILDVEILTKKLEEQSQEIQERLTYLLEAFRLLELDQMNKRAQLRSYPPYKDENSKYYYEIILDEANRVHFQRYQYSKIEKRFEKTTSQLTLEIFERLINDLVDILK